MVKISENVLVSKVKMESDFELIKVAQGLMKYT